jgi:hypothetical protein
MTREWLIDCAWGALLALLILTAILCGTSGAKFIYIDF